MTSWCTLTSYLGAWLVNFCHVTGLLHKYKFCTALHWLAEVKMAMAAKSQIEGE